MSPNMSDESNNQKLIDPIKIFIGHELDDEKSQKAASVIKTNLQSFGSGHFQFVLLSEKPIGTDDRQWIKECVEEADMMFLLCTGPNGPSGSWNWCMLETGWFEGWFEGVKNKVSKPLFVFHSPVIEPPPALGLYRDQTFSAKESQVKKFLENLFGSTEWIKEFGHDQPINKDFIDNDKWVTSVAESICKCFVQPGDIKEVYFAPYTYYDEYIILQVTDIESLRKGKILEENTSVVDSGDNSLELFGLSKSPITSAQWTWKDFKNRFQEAEDHKWISEIEEAIQSASQGYAIKQIEAVFQSPYTNESYVPVLQSQRAPIKLDKTGQAFYW